MPKKSVNPASLEEIYIKVPAVTAIEGKLNSMSPSVEPPPLETELNPNKLKSATSSKTYNSTPFGIPPVKLPSKTPEIIILFVNSPYTTPSALKVTAVTPAEERVTSP